MMRRSPTMVAHTRSRSLMVAKTTGRMTGRDGEQGEMETRLVGSVVRVDRVVIIIASRAQEGTPVDPRVGNGVIKDL